MEPVYRNRHYNVVIGPMGKEGKLGYLVINNATAVVEIEESILPSAISYADQMSEGLDELRGPKKNSEGGNVVPIQ